MIPWENNRNAPSGRTGMVPQDNRDAPPGRTGMLPNLVLNVGVDPLQHPLAGVLVRQVRVHL